MQLSLTTAEKAELTQQRKEKLTYIKKVAIRFPCSSSNFPASDN